LRWKNGRLELRDRIKTPQVLKQFAQQDRLRRGDRRIGVSLTDTDKMDERRARRRNLTGLVKTLTFSGSTRRQWLYLE